MTLQEYLTSLRHKTVAVIGIGVSNTPLLRRLLAEGIAVTACDRSSREKLGPLADELEAAGATLHLGEGYLDGLTQDVIFRTPGLRPDVPQLLAQVTPANYRARIERLFLFHLQAFDWNCPQHITPRYSAQQVAEYSQNLQQRIHDLEQENQRLQQQLASKGDS